ncbi:cupin domain-containing protein [Ancylobacter pratisalsi]|uniref:Cupin domain-containing protein n=1 Tax=Ancylobacter pratisalsi TaxID=1745854 RepID=A0A6P1YR28_9HYPH|nr:cupin domain-containing protein [Ancylobacter pratisalsi]QIB35582.1 cupin domain-containing protein [Ancylobacter pratisalsi]
MNANASATVHPAAAASRFWVLGDQLSIRGNLEGTTLNVVDVVVPPGGGTPPHSHPSPEIFRILDGTIRIWSVVDGRPTEMDAGAGDVVTIAAHAPHGYRNVSGAPVSLMAVVDEQTMGFFRAAATDEAPEGPPTADVIGQIMKLSADHGITILTAP